MNLGFSMYDLAAGMAAIIGTFTMLMIMFGRTEQWSIKKAMIVSILYVVLLAVAGFGGYTLGYGHYLSLAAYFGIELYTFNC